MEKVISILNKKPLTYSVTVTHFADSVEFEVRDTQGDEQSKLSVAHDLENFADLIRKRIKEGDGSNPPPSICC
jgi:hypothetical protein